MLESLTQRFPLKVPEDDPQEALSATIFNVVCVSVLALLAVVVFASIFIFVRKIATSVSTAAVLLLLVIAVSIAGKVNIKIGSIVLVFGLWAVFTVNIVLGGRIDTILAIPYIALIAIAGILLGSPYTILVSVLTAAVGFGMACLLTLGISLPHYYPMPPWSALFVFLFGVFLIVPTINGTLRAFTKSSERLRREIVTRRKSEEEGRRVQALLLAVFETSPAAIFLVDERGIITLANKKMADFFGRPGDEFSGTPYSELVHPEVRSERCADILSVMDETTDSINMETVYLSADGKKFLGRLSGRRLLSPDGCPGGVVGVITDITDQKKAEEELRRSEALYRFLAEHAQDILWTVDLGMRTTYVSPSIERVLGFTVEERMQQAVEEQLTPESLGIAQRRLFEELMIEKEKGLEPDRSMVMELNYLHKNGSIVCLESAMQFIRDDSGIPAGVYGLSRDITDRKKAEEALRRSEEFNRSLVDHAPIGIVYLGKDGTIEYVNPAARKLTGAPENHSSRYLGLGIVDFPGFGEGSTVQEHLRLLLRGESVSNAEITCKGPDGQETVLLFSATPRFGEDGCVEGATIMFTNISERKRAERTEWEMARFRAVADLSGGIAHNFNNLLQIIVGYMELALLDLEEGSHTEVKASLDKVLESSKVGAEVVRRLQTFSRPARRGGASKEVIFDVSDVVGQAAEIGRSWLTSHDKEGLQVSLKTNMLPGCRIKADKNEIFGVVVNLIRNAVEALPMGGTVELATTMEEDKVVLRVTDSGRGISQENLGRLFNPFFTTKAEPGAGLSLATGKKIVDACGGRIMVDSVAGRGTTITVCFPLASELLETTKTSPAENPGRRLTILVIDDTQAITELMQSVLTSSGHIVHTALTGKEGLSIFEANDIDAVVCDLGMPEMNGWEVGKKIRSMCKERGVPKTPFVLLTAWSGQEMEEEKMERSGVDAVVGKPLRIGNILEVIREVCEKNQAGSADEQ